MAGLETTVAVANVSIAHDKQANLARFEELAEEAARQGVTLLLLPEVGLQGYADLGYLMDTPGSAEQKRYYFLEAETIPGPATERLGRLCSRLGLTIQLGLAERALEGNVIYNSVALIGPDGLIGSYRKLHNHFEYPYFNPGSDAPVHDLGVAQAGVLICYDICVPELARSYALRGAELALVSTAWPLRGGDPATDYHAFSMDLALQSTALLNQLWVLCSNHCEQGAYHGGDVNYYGASQIIDPFGHIVAKAGNEDGLLVHTADLRGEVLRARTEGMFGKNLLQDRRPDMYGPVADTGYSRLGRSR